MAHAVSQEGNLTHEGASIADRTDTEKLAFMPFRSGPRQPDVLGPFGSDEARPFVEIRLTDAARILAYEPDPTYRAVTRQRVRQQVYDAYMSGNLRLHREQHVGDARETISHFVDLEIERRLGAIASGVDQSLFAEQRDATVHTAGLLATAEQRVASLERQDSERILRIKQARDYLKEAGTPDSVLRVFDLVSGLDQILKQEAVVTDGRTGPTGTKVLNTAETFREIVGQDSLGAAPTSGDIPVSSPAEHAA